MAGFGVGIDLGDMTPTLGSITIDPGSSFMSGGATSLFKSSVEMVNPNVFTYQLIAPAEVAAEVVLRVTEDVVAFATSYLSEKIAEVVTPPNPADILAKAQTYMSDKIYTMGEVLKKLQEDAEKQVKEKQENSLDKDIKDKIANINKKISNMKDKVDGVLDKVNTYAGYIGTFITQGPKWVEAQANALNKTAKDEIAKFVSEQAQTILDEKQKFIDAQAEKLSDQMASVVNSELEDTAFKTLKQVFILKEEAISKAKVLAKTAILKVLSLVGG